jgi:hypothetical protein
MTRPPRLRCRRRTIAAGLVRLVQFSASRNSPESNAELAGLLNLHRPNRVVKRSRTLEVRYLSAGPHSATLGHQDVVELGRQIGRVDLRIDVEENPPGPAGAEDPLLLVHATRDHGPLPSARVQLHLRVDAVAVAGLVERSLYLWLAAHVTTEIERLLGRTYAVTNGPGGDNTLRYCAAFEFGGGVMREIEDLVHRRILRKSESPWRAAAVRAGHTSLALATQAPSRALDHNAHVELVSDPGRGGVEVGTSRGAEAGHAVASMPLLTLPANDEDVARRVGFGNLHHDQVAVVVFGVGFLRGSQLHAPCCHPTGR